MFADFVNGHHRELPHQAELELAATAMGVASPLSSLSDTCGV